MATRGRRKKEISVEEKIVLVQNEINDLTTQLKDKKKELADLEEEKKAQEQKALLDAIIASGKSAEEVIAFLQK